MTQAAKPGEHPVWEVYDLLKACRLNVGYYAVKVERARRRSLQMEVLLAVTVPSSAVAGLTIWETPYGKSAWGILVVVAAFLAIVKPLLRLTDKVKSYEGSVAEYRAVASELNELRSEIRQSQRYDDAIKERFRRILRRAAKAEEHEPIEGVDKALRDKVQTRINEDLPAKGFFIPED